MQDFRSRGMLTSCSAHLLVFSANFCFTYVCNPKVPGLELSLTYGYPLFIQPHSPLCITIYSRHTADRWVFPPSLSAPSRSTPVTGDSNSCPPDKELEKPAETYTSNRLASYPVRAPNS
jgi:hypothetical protein